MAKKSISKKKALRQQQEREALNHILNVFLLGLAAECYLFGIYRFHSGGSVNSFLLWDNILRVLSIAGVAVAVIAAIAAVVMRKKNKMLRISVITGLCALFVGVTSWIMTRFVDTGAVALCIAVPVVTILGLIYLLYQRECFVSTTLLSGSLFTVLVCGKGLVGSWSTLITACAIAVVVGLIAVTVVIALIRKNGGKLRDVRIFSADCSYAVLFAVCALCALIISAVLFMPTLSFYLTWALVVLLFADLAYYTVKMI